MPTMMPYPVSGGSPVPEKMISETFRWVTNTFVKDWVVLHSFEVSNPSRISFVLLDKTNLCVICLEVVLELTDFVDSSGVCKVFGMNITQLLYLDTNICPRHHSSTNTAKKAQH